MELLYELRLLMEAISVTLKARVPYLVVRIKYIHPAREFSANTLKWPGFLKCNPEVPLPGSIVTSRGVGSIQKVGGTCIQGHSHKQKLGTFYAAKRHFA